MAGEITPREFVERRANGDELVLLDVREEFEREIAQLPDAVWIPMEEVMARISELDRNRTIVVMCRSGGRSQRAANYLYAQGFPDVLNLTGGILRWSDEVDSSIKKY